MDIMHRIHDAACYYKYKSFRKADLALTKSYLLRNPYAMCRKFFTTEVTEITEVKPQGDRLWGELAPAGVPFQATRGGNLSSSANPAKPDRVSPISR